MPLPREHWYRLEIEDRHVGWMHSAAERTFYGGKPAIRVRSELQIELLRSGTPLVLRRIRTVVFSASPPFEPYHFAMSSDESGSERHVVGVVESGGLFLKTEIDGRETESLVDLPEGTLFEEAIPFFLHDRRPQIGDSIRVTVFNGDVLRPVRDEIRFVRREPITLGDETIETSVFDHRLEWMGGLGSTEWLDDSGVLVQMEMEGLGVPMRLRRATIEEATSEEDASDVDVILATKLVPIRGTPSDPERLRARVRLLEGEVEDAIRTTKRQRLLIESDPAVALLEIRRDTPPDVPSPFPVDDPSLARFLEATVYVEADDPVLRDAAAMIVGDAADAWDAVQRITRWVYVHVTDKGLDRGFATARQTFDSRTGDCTEHTMLAVALTRAVGIPARIASGIVWNKDAFYYHFWYEAFVGEWIALDPTLGQIPADARHIEFVGGELESDTALEYAEGILRTLNRLVLTILSDDEK